MANKLWPLPRTAARLSTASAPPAADLARRMLSEPSPAAAAAEETAKMKSLSHRLWALGTAADRGGSGALTMEECIKGRRMLSEPSPAAAAAVAEETANMKPLYHRLWALGTAADRGGSGALTMEECIKRRRMLSELSPAAAEETANLKPLYRRLWALGTAADWDGSVAATMEGWLKERRRTSEIGLIDVVKELRKHKHYKLGLEIIDWMESRGMKMSDDKNAIHLDLIAKVKGIESAESYFSSLPNSEKNLQIYAALLRCYCNESTVDKAIALYDKIKELFVVSRPFIYNILMGLYLKLGQPDMIETLFLEMKANNVLPDIFSYNMLIKSYASLNDIDLVEKIVMEMKFERVKLDWSTYVTLAQVYSSAGLLEKAESAIKNVEKLMGTYNKVGFHFLISSYADAGDLSEVHRVWNSLKATFKKANNMGYLTMLQALNKLDDTDSLKQCFQEWESDYNTYDIRLVNVMIEAYLRKNMMMEAESLFKKATEKGVGPESSYIRLIELFMDYFLKRHEMDFALKRFEVGTSQVKQNQCKLDEEKLNEFLKFFQELKDVDAAEILLKILKKLNCLDGVYESLLHTCMAAGKTEPSL